MNEKKYNKNNYNMNMMMKSRNIDERQLFNRGITDMKMIKNKKKATAYLEKYQNMKS